MHTIMKFHNIGEFVTNATFHILCPWTVTTTFCSRENKQSRVYKIGVHYDLQNSSIFPLEVNWNTYGTCGMSANGL